MPPRSIENGFGKRVSLKQRKLRLKLLSTVDFFAEDCRSQPVSIHSKDASCTFRAVARSGKRSTFAPGIHTAACHPAQHRVNCGVFAVGRPPRVDQRHRDVKQFDSVDFS